ncbi:MAG: phosphoglycerate kinase, partial [Nitrosopumilus sp.]|nr:phosphoglycerate kinase [Nitrosopumilus sp.]
MPSIKSLTDFEDSFYFNKKVFIRVDFNVNVIDGIVSEDYRIRSTMPTIEYLVKRGAKIILGSHLDRPNGKDLRYSLSPVSKKLSEILSPFNIKVYFSNDCMGGGTLDKINQLNKGEVMLLENLRFYSEEEKNDEIFSEKLASYADIYINDAFSTSHRKHSSTYGTVKFFDTKIIGFNVAQEIEYLSLLRDNPPKPFTLLIGGVKIKDKIGALNNLLPKATKVLIGGAASYTFLKASGISVGDSLVDDNYLSWASKALNKYEEKIILPIDHKVAFSENSTEYLMVKKNIPKNMKGFDIGDETVQNFIHEIHNNNNGLGTIFWNGPMGLFEEKPFRTGTMALARIIGSVGKQKSFSVVGGGETVDAIR